jgi:hypothetical protein
MTESCKKVRSLPLLRMRIYFYDKTHIHENTFSFTGTDYILLRPITTFTAPALQFSQHPLRDA